MIVVRDIFELHFGKAREAIQLIREVEELAGRQGSGPARALTDVTGKYYTLVLEQEFEGLGDYEQKTHQALQSPEWQAWYGRFSPLVREGRREIFQVQPLTGESAKARK
jgi:hypothetical protein